MTSRPEFRPSHFGICVSDLDRSMRFYCDGLGFEAGERFDLDSKEAVGLDRGLEVEGHVQVTSQFIRRDGMVVELLGYTTPTPTGRPSTSRGLLGITHLSFYVDELDAAAAHLVVLGATVLEDTRSNPGVDLVFLADPDGVRVELMVAPAT
jgi:catechol 2,3-dioxygenase-like lactoylglutathione lyase family enzyme